MNNNLAIARRKLLKFGVTALGAGVVTKVTASQANSVTEKKLSLLKH